MPVLRKSSSREMPMPFEDNAANILRQPASRLNSEDSIESNSPLSFPFSAKNNRSTFCATLSPLRKNPQ